MQSRWSNLFYTRYILLVSITAAFIGGGQIHAVDSKTIPQGIFTTAAGIEVPMPPIASLDCSEMRLVFETIDASGYRNAAPEPLDPADRGLFQYEQALGEAYYQGCAEEEILGVGTSSTFQRAFNSE